MQHDYVYWKLAAARMRDLIKQAEDDRLVRLCKEEAAEKQSVKGMAAVGVTISICLLLVVILLVR